MRLNNVLGDTFFYCKKIAPDNIIIDLSRNTTHITKVIGVHFIAC